jgi:hypothetical protein
MTDQQLALALSGVLTAGVGFVGYVCYKVPIFALVVALCAGALLFAYR